MPLPVPIELVVDELEMLQQGMLTYVHRQTGELVTLTEEMLDLAHREDDEIFDDEVVEEYSPDNLREILDSADWVALPDAFAIHEWEIMRAFADTVEDTRRSEELHGALRGKGAFRAFKDLVNRYGLQDPWLTYKRQAFEKIARDALDEAGIPHTA
jgi:hypothetical protein